MSWVGRKLIIKKDGVPIAGARAKSVRFNNEPINVSHEEEDGFRHLLDVLDTREVLLSIEGVLSGPHAEQLIRPKVDGELIGVEVVFPDESTLSADGAYIHSLQITGEYRNAAMFAASLVLSGAFEFDDGWTEVRIVMDAAWLASNGRFYNTEFNWPVPAGVSEVDVLLVGGGGCARQSGAGGFQFLSGGGGGGEVVVALGTAVTPGGAVPVTVGGTLNFTLSPDQGRSTSFGSLTAAGGGSANLKLPAESDPAFGGYSPGTPSTGPFSGGMPFIDGSSFGKTGGGGAGASQIGGDAGSNIAPGGGGPGIYVGDVFGSDIGDGGWFGGGGAGSSSNAGVHAAGGLGGGADEQSSTITAADATGGGGWGGTFQSIQITRSNGRSGVVVLMYRLPPS